MTIGDLARLCGHVEIDAEGCWLWTGATIRGYGSLRLARPRRHEYAHRAFYAALVGPIPKGLALDHLCRVHRCVNPRHLEPVTWRENTLRGSLVALKTHCAQGHPWTEENIFVAHTGRRCCRVCKRRREREYGRRVRRERIERFRALSGAYTAPQEASKQ